MDVLWMAKELLWSTPKVVGRIVLVILVTIETEIEEIATIEIGIETGTEEIETEICLILEGASTVEKMVIGLVIALMKLEEIDALIVDVVAILLVNAKKREEFASSRTVVVVADADLDLDPVLVLVLVHPNHRAEAGHLKMVVVVVVVEEADLNPDLQEEVLLLAANHLPHLVGHPLPTMEEILMEKRDLPLLLQGNLVLVPLNCCCC